MVGKLNILSWLKGRNPIIAANNRRFSKIDRAGDFHDYSTRGTPGL